MVVKSIISNAFLDMLACLREFDVRMSNQEIMVMTSL